LIGMVSLAYGRATWHLGRVKRVFLRGQVFFLIGTMCWLSEEAGVLPCPNRFSLHPIWHVCVAHTLMAWSAFLKYHRGLFFGFKVELKGWWWCPYTVWSEPDDPMSNPIIRHAERGERTNPAAGGRRNTYLAAKVQRPTMGTRGSSRGLWRGASFFGHGDSALSGGARRWSVLGAKAQASPPAGGNASGAISVCTAPVEDVEQGNATQAMEGETAVLGQGTSGKAPPAKAALAAEDLSC